MFFVPEGASHCDRSANEWMLFLEWSSLMKTDPALGKSGILQREVKMRAGARAEPCEVPVASDVYTGLS